MSTPANFVSMPAPGLIRQWQDGLQALGKSVQYIAASNPTPRQIKARVVYLAAAELANSIEMYPLRVTVDARDFWSGAPAKGDTIVIDGARRGVMSVAETHIGDTLIAYRLGVQG